MAAMKKDASLILTAVLVSAISYSSATAAIEAAKEWQVKSLKGITSVQYAVGWDPDGRLTEILKSGLAGSNLPIRHVIFQREVPISIDTADALVKVDVDTRENDPKWVGLYVHQKSKLDRDPSITYEARTYSIGELVPSAKVDATVKELVARFGSDFKSANHTSK
jgi:hypothetical protein